MNDYQYIWSEKRSLVNVESHINQYIKNRDILGSTHNYSFIYAKNGFAEELHRNVDSKKWILLGKKFFSKKFILNLLKKGAKLRKDFNIFLSTLTVSNLKKLSDAELAKAFIESTNFHSNLRGYFKTSRPEFLTNAEDKLKSLLRNKLKDEAQFQEVFQIITTPEKMDQVNMETIDWVKLLSKKSAKLGDAILIHIDKYPWLVAHSYDLDEVKTSFINKFSNDLKNLEGLRSEVLELKKYKSKLKHDQRLWLKRLHDKNITYLSWLFRELSLERMKLKGGWSGADFLYFNLYSEISNRAHIALEDLYSIYRINEVIKAIKSRKPEVSKKEKEARKIVYVLWLKDKKLEFFSGEKALSVISKEVEEIAKKDVLKGQVACKGFGKGIVRVIYPGDITMLNDSVKKFKENEVLVTTMTQPNMVSIMKKAVAIVTEEGGLTSHAAIIARELKVPCVVGTKIATKVFKDGDMVEVDANKGIVRKI